MTRQNHFRVTVKFNDGTENAVYEYPTEKIANGVVRRYSKSVFVESVEVEEI